MADPDLGEWMDRDEVIAFVRQQPRRLQRDAQVGGRFGPIPLPHHIVGGTELFKRSEVIDWLETIQIAQRSRKISRTRQRRWR